MTERDAAFWASFFVVFVVPLVMVNVWERKRANKLMERIATEFSSRGTPLSNEQRLTLMARFRLPRWMQSMLKTSRAPLPIIPENYLNEWRSLCKRVKVIRWSILVTGFLFVVVFRELWPKT